MICVGRNEQSCTGLDGAILIAFSSFRQEDFWLLKRVFSHTEVISMRCKPMHLPFLASSLWHTPIWMILCVQVKVLRDNTRLTKEGDPTSKGIAFAEFTDHEHALCALRQLNNNPGPFGTHSVFMPCFGLLNYSFTVPFLCIDHLFWVHKAPDWNIFKLWNRKLLLFTLFQGSFTDCKSKAVFL